MNIKNYRICNIQSKSKFLLKYSVLILRGQLRTHKTFMSLHNSVLYLVEFIDQKGIILYETLVNE